jgi:hypothetical protein
MKKGRPCGRPVLPPNPRESDSRLPALLSHPALPRLSLVHPERGLPAFGPATSGPR